MQRNLILTDVMKTGDHKNIEDFIDLHSLPNQIFTCHDEYYSVGTLDTDSYDRKIAIVDQRSVDEKHPSKNPEFGKELNKRLALLHSQGFVIVHASPWESKENVENMPVYPPHTPDQILWHGGVSWFWFLMSQKRPSRQLIFNHSKKKYTFLYLNKLKRRHRQILFESMSKNGLLDGSLYTYWPDRKLPKEYEIPWIENYPYTGMDQWMFEKPYNDTMYNLVSETNVNNTDVFMTEKIWKAIISQQIFIVHGNYLYLQRLREMGFRTFSHLFDESYDLESDENLKIEKIVSTCKQVKKMNWQDLYLKTQSLRRHNYDNFFDKNRLSKEINKTLLSILELVDLRKVSSTES